ncbi:CAP domain-containing protein [Ramlibacter sp. MMS24-I3-19]|uniref:CAP domain-containing protein n=1 Tax=Ramlibacter sp. MMS24-I3-19 TaxID=3416606 RepID=UPI003D069993
MSTNRTAARTSAVLLAFLLAACGGGNDSGSTGPTPGPGGSSQTGISGAQGSGGGLATAAPTPNYAQGSEELAAFQFLNAERGRCGFGVLAQNTKLDAAARAHADYQLVNDLFTHTEDRAVYPSGFTGTTMVDRFAFQQYTDMGGAVDEITGETGRDDKTGFGVEGIRNLLNAPYHLQGLMSGMREAGVAVRSSRDTGTLTPRVLLQWDGAYTLQAGPQLLASNDVLTYPCEGTTGADRQLTNESPDPVPGRDLTMNPLGTSVYIATRPGNTLAVTAASMTNTRTGGRVALRAAITAANDPQRSYGANEAYVAADAPLDANTAYEVTVAGTNNGAAFTRTFRFTTGP